MNSFFAQHAVTEMAIPVAVVLTVDPKHHEWISKQLYPDPVPVFLSAPVTMERLECLKSWWNDHVQEAEAMLSKPVNEMMFRRATMLVQKSHDNFDIHFQTLMPNAAPDPNQPELLHVLKLLKA